MFFRVWIQLPFFVIFYFMYILCTQFQLEQTLEMPWCGIQAVAKGQHREVLRSGNFHHVQCLCRFGFQVSTLISFVGHCCFQCFLKLTNVNILILNQASLANEISVNRVMWSPDGTLFGMFVAFMIKCLTVYCFNQTLILWEEKDVWPYLLLYQFLEHVLHILTDSPACHIEKFYQNRKK